MKIDYSTLGFNPVVLIDRLTKRFSTVLREPFCLTLPNEKNSLPESILVLYGHKVDGTAISLSIDIEDKDKSDLEIYKETVDFIEKNNLDVIKLETGK